VVHKRLLTSTVKEALAESAREAEKEVLTLEEAAALLNRHPKIVAKMAREDGLPAHGISPREMRFFRSEIHAWLKAREPNTKDEA
jgi:excisionase family DNA binding protein